MKVQWKKNKNLKPSVILKKIDNEKKLENGRVSFSGFEFQDAIVAIESMINFPIIANDLDKHTLIQKTVWQAAKNTKIEPDKFLSILKDNISIELNKRNNTYYLLTSLSMRLSHTRKISFENFNFRFYKDNFPKKFRGRKNLISENRDNIETESDGYTKVVVELEAKSETIAANKAVKALDILRGFFCIQCNSFSEIIGNESESINKIRLGEFHTLHNASGEVFEQSFWYDPSYSKAKVYLFRDEKNVVKNIRSIINIFSKFNKNYRNIMSDSILRFVRAFDEKNQNIAILRAWGALEALAAPNESNFDSVTTRCAFIFEDYEYHRQILEHLREYRNRNVHAGQESAIAKTYSFQVQRYFRELFLFHIRRQGDFESIEEANRFLDLPADKDKIFYLKSMVEKSISFRGYT
ncbi:MULTISPECIES: hypothetical protein [unclassified Psychrobacter]|uniref:hypothetical protein n=1 Tax=unclassified Psychrobacter TaxID=196806 RepID=UPI0018F4A474|nr:MULTISPECIES: hypothetical protein [unclassified Psychrobacter]